jgi:alpha,alpha-trehalase
MDYDLSSQRHTNVFSLAGMYPLFVGIADRRKAESVSKILRQELLYPGGLVSTNVNTHHQWDAPNGWAPLQWISYKGLKRYSMEELADEIKSRWMTLNEKVFASTGKLMEKYNVADLSLEAGGGEYDVQDGFGWTNGVYLAMKYD